MTEPTQKIAPWEDFILRVIAIYKLIHAAFFIAVGFGLLRLRHHNIVQFLNDYFIVPYHINPESHIVDWLLDQAQTITSHKLAFFGYAAFFYAALFAAEGVGLFLRKRWAEYMVVVVTGSFLPFEVYEIFVHVAWWKFVLVLGNLLIVGYLIHRLFLDARNKELGSPSEKSQASAPPSAVSKVIPSEVP